MGARSYHDPQSLNNNDLSSQLWASDKYCVKLPRTDEGKSEGLYRFYGTNLNSWNNLDKLTHE